MDEGILVINKPKGMTSFNLVRILRKHLGVMKIGHAGTLDPFAEGVMIMLIGRNYTRLSDSFLNQEKEYVGTIRFGITTDTYDNEGEITHESAIIPTLEELELAIQKFQGTIQQVPPMYSAKKVNGKKLYELARAGKTIERQPVDVTLQTTLKSYSYPYAEIAVSCSKGTYIRSIAHDMGEMLGCGGHLVALTRTRSGRYSLSDCLPSECLTLPEKLRENLKS